MTTARDDLRTTSIFRFRSLTNNLNFLNNQNTHKMSLFIIITLLHTVRLKQFDRLAQRIKFIHANIFPLPYIYGVGRDNIRSRKRAALPSLYEAVCDSII
jgi:hypothetical protein